MTKKNKHLQNDWVSKRITPDDAPNSLIATKGQDD